MDYEATNNPLSSVEAARRFNLTNDHIASLCRRGLVRAVRANHQWFVDTGSLERYIAEQGVKEARRRKELSESLAASYRQGVGRRASERGALLHPPAYLTTLEAATRYGATREFIARLCREGKLAAMRVEEAWFIDPASLDVVIATRDAQRSVASEQLAQLRDEERRDSREQSLARGANTRVYTSEDAPRHARVHRHRGPNFLYGLVAATLSFTFVFGSIAVISLEAPRDAAREVQRLARDARSAIADANMHTFSVSGGMSSLAAAAASLSAAAVHSDFLGGRQEVSGSLFERALSRVQQLLHQALEGAPTSGEETNLVLVPLPASPSGSLPAQETADTASFAPVMPPQRVTPTATVTAQAPAYALAPLSVILAGVSHEYVDTQLSTLKNSLSSEIFKYSSQMVPGVSQNVVNLAHAQRIDYLLRPTIDAARISAADLAGSTFTDGIVRDSSVSARDLSVSGTVIFASGAIFSGGSLSLPYFTASATDTPSSVAYRLGVGTTSPSTTFAVHGGSYVSGTAFFGDAITASSTLTVLGDTTLSNATSSALFATTASSTNLFASTAQLGSLSVLSHLSVGGLATLSAGALSLASSTFGGGAQPSGLTIWGGATTTGSSYIEVGLGIGIATTAPGVLETSGNAYVGGDLFVGGNSTTIGNSSANSLVINSSIKSNLTPDQNITYDLGSPSFYWRNVYVGNIVANNISAASTTIAGTASQTFTINSDNVSADAEDSDLIFFRGSVVPNALLSWMSSTKRFQLNQPLFIQNASSDTLGTITLSLRGAAGQTGNLFQIASSTGGAVFSVASDGAVTISTSTISALTTGTTTISNLSVTNTSTSTFAGAISLAGLTASGPAAFGASLAVAGTASFADATLAHATATSLFAPNANLGTLTYGGVTLSSAVTGTGAMVLSSSPTLVTPNLGTPSAITLTNATGLPVSTGLSGLASGIAAFLGAPSSVNLAAALTNESGSGAAVFATGPVITGATLSGDISLPGGIWTSGGVLGIGTTTPGHKLEVASAVDGDGLWMQATAGVGTGVSLLNSSYSRVASFGIAGASANWLSTTVAGDAVLLNKQANSLLFATNNTERMRVDANGNVGIGTTTPRAVLELGSAATADRFARFSNGLMPNGFDVGVSSSAAGGYIITRDDASLDLGTNNTTGRMVITGSGNVGINKINPGWLFNVRATGTSTFPFVISKHDDSATGFYVEEVSTGDFNLRIANAGNAATVLLNSNGTSYLNGGNVGIGTTTPVATLSVAGNTFLGGNLTTTGAAAIQGGDLTLNKAGGAAVRFQDGAFAGAVGYMDTSGGLISQNWSNIVFKTGDPSPIERMRITASGNFGIGTTTPGNKLQVRGVSTASQIRFGAVDTGGSYFTSTNANDGYFSSGAEYLSSNWTARDTVATIVGGGNGFVRFYTDSVLTPGSTFSPTERMRINSSGSVGIGTTTPQYGLSVQGSAQIYGGNLYTPTELQILNGPSAQGIKTGSLWVSNSYSGTAPTNGAYIQGNVGIGTTGPAEKLEVAGNVLIGNNQSYKIKNSSGMAVSVLSADTSNTTRLNSVGSNLHINPDQSNSPTYINYNNGGIVVVGDGVTASPFAISKGYLDVYTSNPGGDSLRVWNAASGSATKFLTIKPETATDQGSIGYWTGSAFGKLDLPASETHLYGGGAEVMRVSSAGVVGIGTTNPGGGDTSYKLDVVGNQNSNFISRVYNNNAGNSAAARFDLATGIPNAYAIMSVNNNGGNPYLNISTGGGVTAGTYYDSGLHIFRTSAGTEMMRINSTGNVGIGTTTPTEKLSVLSADNSFSTNVLAVRANNLSVGVGIGYNAIRAVGTNGNNSLYIDSQNSSGTLNLQSQSGGNVGIGTTGPQRKLDVIGTVRASNEVQSTSNIAFRQVSGDYGLMHYTDGANYYMLLTNAADQYGGWNSLRPLRVSVTTGDVFMGNDAVTVKHGGNVGIGTVSPAARLAVGSPGNANSAIFGNGGGSTNDGIYGYITGTGRAIVGDSSGSGGTGIAGYSGSGDGGYFTSTSGNALITGTGNVGIGTTNPVGKFAVEEGNGDGIVIRQPTDNQMAIQMYIDGHYSARTTYGSGCCNDLYLQPDVGNVHLGPNFSVDHAGDFSAIGSIAGGFTSILQNSSNNSAAYALLSVRNDSGNGVHLFENSSTRSADGGANTATLRNDVGALRLQSAGGGGLTVAATSGDVSASGNLTVTSGLTAYGTSRIANSQINTDAVEQSLYGSGDRWSYIDFHTDDTYTDYGLRLLKAPGANSDSYLQTRGTGTFYVRTDDAAAIQFQTNSTARLTIDSAGNMTATGILTSTSVGNPAFQLNGSAGNNRYIRILSTGSVRWDYGASADAESGGNAGTNFFINRFDDAGNYLSTPLQIARSNGTITASGLLYASGGLEFPQNAWMYAPGGVGRSWYISASDMYWELGGAGSFHFRNSSDVDQLTIANNGNMSFAASNPSITSGGSYITIPNGLYVSGGTPYFQTQAQFRGGIHNDSAAYLQVSGGTSGYTYFSGSVGIGTQTPAGSLHVSDTSNPIIFTPKGNDLSSDNIGFEIRNQTYVNGNYANRFVSNDNGGGIPLYVQGNLVGDGTTWTSLARFGTFTGNSNYFETFGATKIGGALTYGGVTLSNAVTGAGNMVLSASPSISGTLTLPTDSTSGGLTMGVGGTWRVWTDISFGNFNITNSSFTSGATLNGSSWAAYSDERLKDDIEDYSVLDRLSDYRAVSFNWKDTGNRDLGVVAQEVYRIFPELVIPGDTSSELSTSTPYGRWQVKYDRFGALALEGVKELNDKVDAAFRPWFTAGAEDIRAFSATTTAAEIITASSTVSTSTPWAAAFAGTSGVLKEQVSSIGDMVVHVVARAVYASVGIFDQVFAKTIHVDTLHAQELCLGETCVTEDQLKTLIQNSLHNQNGGSGTGSPEMPPSSALIVTLIGNDPAHVMVGATYADPGAMVSSESQPNRGLTVAVDGVPVPNVSIDTGAAGEHTITYTAIDAEGRIGVATRMVIVEEPSSAADTIGPLITVNGANPAHVHIGDIYVDLGALVSDNVDQNLGYNVSLHGGATTTIEALSLDTSTSTSHTILFTAVDQAGNVGMATRTVVVEN